MRKEDNSAVIFNHSLTADFNSQPDDDDLEEYIIACDSKVPIAAMPTSAITPVIDQDSLGYNSQKPEQIEDDTKTKSFMEKHKQSARYFVQQNKDIDIHQLSHQSCCRWVLGLILLSPALIIRGLMSLGGYIFNVILKLFSFCQSKGTKTRTQSYWRDPNLLPSAIPIVAIENFKDIWPQGDILESEPYRLKLRKFLRKSQEDGDLCAIHGELVEVCDKNYVNRLQVCLQEMPQSVEYDKTELLHRCLFYGSNEAVMVILKSVAPNEILPLISQLHNHVTALHVAIAQQNSEMIDVMLNMMNPEERYHALHVQSKQTCKNAMEAVDLPLHLALWTGNIKLIQTLISHGAEFSAQDECGYTALHVLVMVANKQPQLALHVYDTILESIPVWLKKTKHHPQLCQMSQKYAQQLVLWRLFHILDKDGCTPLQLAAWYGTKTLLEKFLNTDEVYRFSFSHSNMIKPHDLALYDISEIEPRFSYHNSTASILEIILLNSSDDQLQCLEIPIIDELCQLKWQQFGHYFRFWGAIHLLLTLLISYYVCCHALPNMVPIAIGITSSNETDRHNISQLTNPNRFTFTNGDLAILLIAVLYFWYVVLFLCVIIKIHWRRRWSLKHKSAGNNWSMTIFNCNPLLLFSVSLMSYLLLKWLHNTNEFYLLSLAVLGAWFHVLMLSQGIRSTAFFVIMFQRIMFGDFTRFMVVIFIMSIWATLMTMILNFGYLKEGETFYSFSEILIEYLRIGPGLSDFDLLLKGGWYNIVLYFGAVCAMNVLCMNLLIAAMANTYAEINKVSHLLCRKVRAAELIALEWMSIAYLRNLAIPASEQRIIRIDLPDGTIEEKTVYLLEAGNGQ